MTADPDWMLLDRYLSGECTLDEATAIDAWVMADPSHARLLASMRRVWIEAATPLPAVDERGAWHALQERLTAATPAVPRSFTMRRARRMTWRSPALAAGIAATIIVGAIGWWRHADGARIAILEPSREYVAARGQRAEITLIDGTRVWLSVDSRMRVPQGYNAATRDVELTGEAFFVVEHDAHRPFRVHAGNGVSEDIGTEFSMRAYPGDTETVVIVASGRVALRPAETPAVRGRATELGRGQMGRLDQNGGVEVVDHVDVDASLAWRNGQLQFAERPLQDVVRELERWYDIDVTIEDSALASVPVTASFTNQSADEALAIIAGTLGVHCTRDGRYVRIHHDDGHSR
jgi:transmembrane sensor